MAYDLEDSVTPGKKAEARANVRNVLRRRPRGKGVGEYAVRINSVGSGLAEDDLTAVVTKFPCAPYYRHHVVIIHGALRT